MYALVRFVEYKTDKRYVVPVADITNFAPKHDLDFDNTVPYDAYWFDKDEDDNSGIYAVQNLKLAVKFSMCDISARMHCLAERSKIGQTVTGKYAKAMRVSNSIAAATSRPTFFRFISFETRAPNLRQTVPKGDAASVRVVRSTPGKQRRNARVAVASVSSVRD
ncbi:hypothetical protein HPB50_011227 [Hyalomma asiaticum]|uniref:Uncharacterized protein n=1 Tax=Hyalomma asiaticum TaxID=266040 RepID=A0ACB7SZS0_HYAAI|nr:hypothetical protein HPB50_011227 [Hyalomma asiaticum]